MEVSRRPIRRSFLYSLFEKMARALGIIKPYKRKESFPVIFEELEKWQVWFYILLSYSNALLEFTICVGQQREGYSRRYRTERREIRMT